MSVRVGVRFLVGALGALWASSAAAQTSIYETPEAREFYGANDPLSAPSAWSARLQRWANDTCRASVKSKAESFRKNQSQRAQQRALPGENLKHRFLAYPGSELFHLVATDVVPSQARTNPYARASRPYEARLSSRIAASRAHSLEPADVMRMALEVTRNDYRLAALTAHAVLKEAAKLGRIAARDSEDSRQAYLRAMKLRPRSRSVDLARRRYLADLTQARMLLQKHNRVVRPLKSLRADPSRIRDKMGPWYHIFALFTLDALGGGEQALAAYAAEHGGKYFSAFLQEGGYEPEKKRIDEMFVKTQIVCVAEPTAPPVAPPTPVSPPVAKAPARHVLCPTTRYPLIPAYVSGTVDYSPGRMTLRKNALDSEYHARCRYGRVGQQVFHIDITWKAESGGHPGDPSKARRCYKRWNNMGTFGWNYEFGHPAKSITVQIGRKFEGGNRYSDPLNRSERDGVARQIMKEVEPLAHACASN